MHSLHVSSVPWSTFLKKVSLYLFRIVGWPSEVPPLVAALYSRTWHHCTWSFLQTVFVMGHWKWRCGRMVCFLPFYSLNCALILFLWLEEQSYPVNGSHHGQIPLVVADNGMILRRVSDSPLCGQQPSGRWTLHKCYPCPSNYPADGLSPPNRPGGIFLMTRTSSRPTSPPTSISPLGNCRGESRWSHEFCPVPDGSGQHVQFTFWWCRRGIIQAVWAIRLH